MEDFSQTKITRLAELLKRKGLTLATAESCTGGLLGGALTSVAGSSSFFRGGVIAYDNAIKRAVLGVPQDDLVNYGAVSGQAVRAMASGAAKLFGCDCAASVSGIAGPGGGTDSKPVGLVFIGIYYNEQTYVRSFTFDGGREAVRTQSVASAIDFLIDVIAGSAPP